jgi:hypothetical protein
VIEARRREGWCAETIEAYLKTQSIQVSHGSIYTILKTNGLITKPYKSRKQRTFIRQLAFLQAALAYDFLSLCHPPRETGDPSLLTAFSMPWSRGIHRFRRQILGWEELEFLLGLR